MMATMKQLVSEGVRSSGWLLLAPLLAAYGPRDLPKMYFNMHLRRYASRLVPFLDPFVTIDVVRRSSTFDHQSSESGQASSNAYKEVEAYLTKVCSREALAFRAEGAAEGAVEGRSFSLSLGERQEVTDHFHGVTVWWLLEKTCIRLMFPQRHRAMIVDEYLPHVRRTGREDMFVTIDIEEKPSESTDELKSGVAFEDVMAYLSSACSRDALNLYAAEGTIKDDSFLLGLRDGEEVADHFRDVTLWWLSIHYKRRSDSSPKKCLRLMFPQQHRAMILNEYLPHVRREGRDITFGKRRQRLYTNNARSPYSLDGPWSHVDFDHPTNFHTLAMPPNKKLKIVKDLEKFSGNKDYYRRIGKPWKRGYLLYGPPGTGKSTMIAAMANHLNYDIYDIELTTVKSNSELRSLFVATTGKSIIVIEDIDCCFDDFNGQRMENQRCTPPSNDKSHQKVTLSGLLNFIDGVWSAQSGERIIVLTTNFPDKLDPALLRSGRMDMHVEMSYCCFEAFEMLARNYLDVEAHPLFQRVKDLLQVVEITPADVAECLLWSHADADDGGVETCLRRLIDKLEKAQEEKNKKVENKAVAKPKPKRLRRRY